MAEEQGADNIAFCSMKNKLDIEECPVDDHFDKCIVVKAFSLSKNTTIFKRECTSRRLCEERKACSDPDFSDCQYECCSGDLCNNFDFTNNAVTNTPQPTISPTTRKYLELTVSEGVENTVTKKFEESTEVPKQSTQPVEKPTRIVPPTKTQTTSSNENEGKFIIFNGF